ncbi:MAG: 2-dehydro-3-deoxyphosphooctonate aldolase [Planctomycetes bacterium SM23_32]|nr:MAG: 2-dehydro-3-deoxyphosphooctonate aldolase [Planctomycetes bacterium SM23_32]
MGQVAITDSVSVGDGRPLLVVAGPCVIEGRQLCLDVAGRLKEACSQVGLPYVFKASFDKANRTSVSSFRGVGLEEGLRVLGEVREQVGVPVLTDVHLPSQAEAAARVVDVLQIPAFLCRQTDLITAAGRTGLPVNLKKGQFMAPEDMARAAEKVASTGNNRVLLCERGTCFGYHDLVVDMRSIVRMKAIGYPVLFDATHSTQQPGALGTESGGQSEMVAPLAAAAVAPGADGVFVETHPDPDRALSDARTMLQLDAVPHLLERLKAIAALSGKPQ